MIKKVILGMFLLGFIPNTHTEIKAQSYTTQSKSCGSCGKQVSIHSKIGDYCPHCGVRWGYENERRTTYSSPDYSKSFGDMSKKIYSYDEIAQSINRVSKQVREDALIQANPIGYMQQKQQELYKAGRIKEAQSMSPIIGQLKLKKYEEDKMKFLQEKKDFQENIIKKLDGYSTITGKTYETLLKNISLLNPEDPNYKSKYDAGIRKIQDFEKEAQNAYNDLAKKKANFKEDSFEAIYNSKMYEDFSKAKGFWNSVGGAIEGTIELAGKGLMGFANAVGNKVANVFGGNYGNGTGRDYFFDDYENHNIKKLDRLNRQLGADTILKELQAERDNLIKTPEYKKAVEDVKYEQEQLKKAGFADKTGGVYKSNPSMIKLRNLDRSIDKLQKYKNGSSDVSWDESFVNPTMEAFSY
jgi:hypothetical protein